MHCWLRPKAKRGSKGKISALVLPIILVLPSPPLPFLAPARTSTRTLTPAFHARLDRITGVEMRGIPTPRSLNPHSKISCWSVSQLFLEAISHVFQMHLISPLFDGT